MTQSGDLLENVIAEWANGILKTEWLYKMSIAARAECRSALERIIDFYNSGQPHMSIEMQTQEVANMHDGVQKRCSKKLKGCLITEDRERVIEFLKET